MSLLVCSRCYAEKDPDSFAPDKRRETGRLSVCRSCVRSIRTGTSQPSSSHITCRSCNQPKPFTADHFQPYKSDGREGLRLVCRSCYAANRSEKRSDEIEIPITVEAPETRACVEQVSPPPKLVIPPGSRPPEIPPDAFAEASHPTPVRMICDSDLHYPIDDPYVTAAKLAFARDFRPDVWVNVGDTYDCWSVSRHEKEAEKWTEPGARLQEEFDSAHDYWREVTSIARNVHFIPGNHERRLAALVNANQGLFGLRALEWGALAGIPSSVQIHPYGTQLEIGGCTFEHGDRISGNFGAIHLSYLALAKRVTCVVFGHSHRVDTRYRTFRRDGEVKTIVAHNQGHGSDVSKQTYAGPCPDWQHGFSALEWFSVGGRPQFTLHPIVLVRGRFSFGGTVYDGHACQ